MTPPIGLSSPFGLDQGVLESSLWEATQMSSRPSTAINSKKRSLAGVWGMRVGGVRRGFF
jgi:hypothetical protein